MKGSEVIGWDAVPSTVAAITWQPVYVSAHRRNVGNILFNDAESCRLHVSRFAGRKIPRVES